jgi:hypothetical protein
MSPATNRSMHQSVTTATMLAVSVLATAGCDDGATYSTATPKPATVSSAPAPAAASNANGQASTAPTGKRQSSSVLGKARDRALDVRDQMEARDRQIQKQIDDIQP